MDYEASRENCDAKPLVNMEAIRHVIDRMEKGWSPGRIVNRYRKTHGKAFSVSVSSIYRYAVLGLFRPFKNPLIRKERKQKNHEQETRSTGCPEMY